MISNSDKILEGFSPDHNLWFCLGPGHTRPVAALKRVHSGVATATRLVVAGQCELLSNIPTTQILSALHKLQCSASSSLQGCFRWYEEEDEPVDTNASFFIGLNLIVLHIKFCDQLEEEARRELDGMLAGLLVWFERAAQHRCFNYPNKYLGDLVCGWLLGERVGGRTKHGNFARLMDEAAEYWLQEHWGWGEHLSDCYTGVMLNELSCLLLFARQLPSELYFKYRKLFDGLLAIEDAFDGGPRVPAIRTYAFDGHPANTAFRDTVKPWRKSGESLQEVLAHPTHFRFGEIFHSAGWHEMAGSSNPRKEHVRIPCFGGATAQVWVTDTARLGTMSRYPIMPNTDHAKWGLSWQSMPVAFASGDCWGFLRWHTREAGLDRHHPARDKHSAYLNNALTDTVAPPIVGHTHSLQDGPDACILRRMPSLSGQWEILGDQWVLCGTSFRVLEEEVGSAVSRLLLEVNGRPMTVFSIALGIPPRLKLEIGKEGLIWDASWAQEALKGQERMACVWMIGWGRDVPRPDPAEKLDIADRIPGKEHWRFWWPHQGGSKVVVAYPLAEVEALTLEAPQQRIATPSSGKDSNRGTRIREGTEWDTAYWYNANDDSLPRILLVGDSICNAYQTSVRDELAGVAYVSFWATSKCVTDRSYLKQLAYILEEYPYAVVHFNNGLHSLQTDPADWEIGFRSAQLLIREKQPEAKMILATSTPLKNAALTEKVNVINKLCMRMAKESGVPVNDLYSLMDPMDRNTWWTDTYHFNLEGQKLQAIQVAETIRSALGGHLVSDAQARIALDRAASETGPDGPMHFTSASATSGSDQTT